MKKQQARILELEKLIAQHKAAYYSGQAIITDEAYDKLEQELKIIDPQNPMLQLVGSPIDDIVGKVAHEKKMLSLEKTYETADLKKFRELGTILSVFKIDGSSCSLIYQNGHLVLAKTRGDGSFGENITMKAVYIHDIPKSIPQQGRVEIRGEIYCRTEEFGHIVKAMEKIGLEKPNSQRNIVAGLLGRKESIHLSQFLSFKAFDLLSRDLKIEKEHQKLDTLADWKFDIPDYVLHKDDKSIEKRVEETKLFMEEGDYLIDGLVFVYDDLSLHEELGETGHHPRYKIAFKFQGGTKQAKINSITWQVSRNGILTPVAEIEPTELSGAMISRVTLHNLGVVENFSLKSGDEIEIVRSGEVIPKFLAVVKSIEGKPSIPKICPSCHCDVEKQDIRLVCINFKCPDQVKERILHWVRVAGIDDLSDKRVGEMLISGLIKDIPDLYKLTSEKLMTLDKVKDKLANKVLENVSKTKELELPVFLAAVGIEGVSKVKCEKIVANGFNSLDKVLDLTIDKLVEIEGFAEKSATDFINSLANKKTLIKKLVESGIHIKATEIPTNGVLNGKKICITGSLSMPRADMEKKIKLAGGIMVSSVSKNTNILLTNDTDPQSSKFKKAVELNIPIMDEKKFLDLLEN